MLYLNCKTNGNNKQLLSNRNSDAHKRRQADQKKDTVGSAILSLLFNLIANINKVLMHNISRKTLLNRIYLISCSNWELLNEPILNILTKTATTKNTQIMFEYPQYEKT